MVSFTVALVGLALATVCAMADPIAPEPVLQPVVKSPTLHLAKPASIADPIAPEPVLQPVVKSPTLHLAKPASMADLIAPEPVLQPVVKSPTLHLAKPESMLSSGGSSRIINGETATPGQFPHQATLLNDGSHMCGASVIAREWVVTAAHCVDGQNINSLSIVVDLHDFSNPGDYKWFDIIRITMHPQYNQGSGTYPNDIALLRLDTNGQSADIGRNIIELASGSDDYAGQTGTISGWGVIETGSSPSTLQYAVVDVFSNSECSRVWNSATIIPGHICVGGYSGSCNGDSGGPLVVNGKLAGVTSWGISGCHNNGQVEYPSVYSRVASYFDWINTNCGCV